MIIVLYPPPPKKKKKKKTILIIRAPILFHFLTFYSSLVTEAPRRPISHPGWLPLKGSPQERLQLRIRHSISIKTHDDPACLQGSGFRERVLGFSIQGFPPRNRR